MIPARRFDSSQKRFTSPQIERHRGRRLLLATGLGLPWLASSATAQMAAVQDDWAAFRGRFLTPKGRIVDTGNRNVSHSEGQSYGLLAAVRADDAAAFSRILTWTLGNLRRRADELTSWRYQPESIPPVLDANNATDGDLMMAWALLEAGQRWRNPDMRRRSLAIARDILRLCTTRVGNRLLLLPGAFGFQNRGRTVINPSYYVFPAIRALAQETGDPAWERIAEDGLTLLREAKFGRWNLPPDWVELTPEESFVSLPQAWPPRFSFDAIRVPLYLVWGGYAGEPAVRSALAFWFAPAHRAVPAWTDFRTGMNAPYPASSGMVAVARLAQAANAGRGDPAGMPPISAAQDYYAAALGLLARMAWRDLRLG